MEQPLEFNVHDWLCEDTPFDGDYDSVPSYVIQMFGKDAAGRSVSVTASGFPPHFYISLPCQFQQRHTDELSSMIKEKCGNGFKGCKPLKRKDVWGFQNGEERHFMQLLFHNHASMKKGSYLFNRTIRLASVGRVHRYQLYESNIEPFIRFFHKQNIRPSGWVSVKNWRQNHGAYRTSCDVDAIARWGDVEGRPRPAPSRHCRPRG